MNSFRSRTTLATAQGDVEMYRLSAVPGSEALPFCHKVILENLLRNEDGDLVGTDDVEALVSGAPRPYDIAFHPTRAFLHDTNGVPVLTDLAALREAVAAAGGDPGSLDIVIPAELTVDHSVVTDFYARPDAPALNVRREYQRNTERYRFLKWGQQAFERLRVVPPGAGIMHQINVEFLADVVTVRDGVAFPDTVAGTDSHTTMVNGLSVLAWGVGGIEASAAMLGQPVSMLIPPVVGVELVGELPVGVTATDLVLTLTERMRAVGVVGKIVEFFGAGVAATSIATRCTIANMSPEFGSTAAIFPIDQATIDFLLLTGRSAAHAQTVATYAQAQGLWHDPGHRPRFDQVVVVDLSTITPSLAGPRRPQDRIELPAMRTGFRRELTRMTGQPAASLDLGSAERPGHGAVAIASITSCTNTSNPSVMIGAGLLARNAVQRGLASRSWVKTSLAPGSRVVTDYLQRAGLTPYLDQLGFGLVGYGCMTCIGNSGGLAPELADRVGAERLQVAAVLSGNRNFDGRINNDVSMNFLASPPLVIAFALAGRVDIDLATEPLGHDPSGAPVLLADIWPRESEIESLIREAIEPRMYTEVYTTIFDGDENWRGLEAPTGPTYAWDDDSTYLRRPPFLDAAPVGAEPTALQDIVGARVLGCYGDSITTDHICPAGRVPVDSAAGRHLRTRGVRPTDLNSYASRRGNWQVMRLGGFTNQRLHNRLLPAGPPAHTLRFDSPETGLGDAAVEEIHSAADGYAADGVPLVVLAGKEYGTGSSRDWAAKVTRLLGVRAVIAESFERIHRSNLVGMGVLPLQFSPGESIERLGLDGSEVFSITGLAGLERPPKTVQVEAVHPITQTRTTFAVIVRLDTSREQRYYRAGGLLPFVLGTVLDRSTPTPEKEPIRR